MRIPDLFHSPRALTKCVLAAILASSMTLSANAQNNLTKEQIMSMSADDLATLPLEELMQAVETLGVSSVDELFAAIMNKSVASASKKEEDTFHSPLSTSVITKDEMRSYGVTSIEEALRLIPGMIVTEKTNGMYDVQMRGLNNIPDNNMFLYTENANTLLLIDGRPMQNSMMGALTFDLLPIDIEDISRIEVVRGACSALYGANAVTGLINIITEHPDESEAFIKGSVQAGTRDTYIVNTAIRKKFGNKVAAGLTFNLQSRRRPTDKVYIMPGQEGLYMVSEVAQNLLPQTGQVIPAADINQMMLSNQFASMEQGGYVNISELKNLRQLFKDQMGLIAFECLEPETPAEKMFPDPGLSRKTYGINGYLSIIPNSKIRLDFSGGYQNSYVNTTPVCDDYFSMNGRKSQSGYAALNSHFGDLSFIVNFCGGDQEHSVGVPGFKAYSGTLNAQLEYDIKLLDKLTIRPGIFFQNVHCENYQPEWDVKITNPMEERTDYTWHYEHPGYTYEPGVYDHLSGFFKQGTRTDVNTVAPSIRLDYQGENLRLIGAFRTDKTNNPDRWTPSWQLAASYSVNPKNFIRVVYGRANRGTNMVNSITDFEWLRTNLVYPNRLHFSANDDADFMKIDNIEFGYRVKPTENIIIDAEAFYSFSRDYGALMAHNSTVNVTTSDLNDVLYTIKYLVDDYYKDFIVGSRPNPVAGMPDLPIFADNAKATYQEQFDDIIMSMLMKTTVFGHKTIQQVMQPCASIQHKTLPYEVKQVGLSINMDWIISSNLLAKVALNAQHTQISKYFIYSQTKDITNMLNASGTEAIANVQKAYYDVISAYLGNEKTINQAADYYLAGYYEEGDGVSMFSKTQAKEYKDEQSNHHVHKATPTFYGMIGLIHKPMEKLELSAFANFMTKRTYLTKYGADELTPICNINAKVGYKPSKNSEIFISGHNLLNSKKREFTHCDEIGSTFLVGFNFGL